MIIAAWGTYTTKTEEFPFEPMATFIVIFAGWAFCEFKSDGTPPGKHSAHPHDIVLGNRLRRLLNEPTRQFLRNHGFGQPFPHERLEPIETFIFDWQGAQHHFDDQALDNLAFEIHALCDSFHEKLVVYAGPAGNWPGYHLSIPTDAERAADEFKPHTVEHIREINDLAAQIVAKIDEFETAFRRHTPEGYEPLG